MSDFEHIRFLAERVLRQEADQSDLDELIGIIGSDSEESFQYLEQLVSAKILPDRTPLDEASIRKMCALIIQSDAVQETPVISLRKRPSIRKWWWVAASVLLALGMTIYLWFNEATKQNKVLAEKEQVITPGKSGAILTLADGKQVVLDSAGNGLIAMQNGAKVVLNNNKISYDSGEQQDAPIVYNTLATPNGRQFQVTLPDGTMVWLNAASSISYPTTFNKQERKVSIKGEVYFEVAKNQETPFFVDVDGKINIQVLGTSFNINAYADEQQISTSLLEGSIRLTGQSTFADNLKGEILKPGQQAISTSRGTKIIDNGDLLMATAWKNGKFQFNYTPLTEVLRQFARWYDIEVVYEKNAPGFTLSGSFKRDFTLSEALKTLELMGLHYRIEDRKLIIMP